MAGVLRLLVCLCAAASLGCPALAGPPFLSDDPDPTPRGHYEIYAFASGGWARGGSEGAAGVDFNYGASPDLQLTATLPVAFAHASGEDTRTGTGDIEFAAKLRFLHQEDFGWDVAVFPRLFVPSGSDLSGEHVSLLIPIWIGREWDDWSTFGGGGCVLNRGGDSKDFCIAGWALTRRILPNLQLGAEVFHEGADTEGGLASTIAGLGLTFDASEHLHFLAYAGAGLENTAETRRGTAYASMLFTF